MGSAGYINISCIFWVIKKNSAQIISHGDNYCMKKVIELLITSCAHHRRFSLKDRGEEKWEAKTSRVIFLMLIMHKKLSLVPVLHFRGEIILPMQFDPNYQPGAPLNLNFYFCLFLPKTDTTELNTGIFILEDTSWLKIHHLKLDYNVSNHKKKKKNQMDGWMGNPISKRVNILVLDVEPQISLFPKEIWGFISLN